ncbi:MAG: phosphatidylglycerophosphatase A [Gammaproteobacteria bacterium]|nr:phosphatidylglycerophosphatase A [Gammaproteobacteria bacterium]
MTRPRPDWRDPVQFVACGFGAGLAPKAPGTFGTLVALPLWWLLQPLPLPVYLGVVALLSIIGVWLCDRAAARLGVHDHPAIVWDEIVGYLVTMVAAPAGWLPMLLGFVLFRAFDILKPWPIRWLDRKVHGGVGIMADDLLAGLFAAVALQVALISM